MYCPMMSGIITGIKSSVGLAKYDCLKEECAWWDLEDEGCSVHLIAKFVVYLDRNVMGIRENMLKGGKA